MRVEGNYKDWKIEEMESREIRNEKKYYRIRQRKRSRSWKRYELIKKII